MNIVPETWLVYDLVDEPLFFHVLEEAQQCAKDFADEWREPVHVFKVVEIAVYRPRFKLL